MAPAPVVLQYFIPKNRTATVAAQMTAFGSLDLNRGPTGGKPLDKLYLEITSSVVTDTGPGNPDAPLLRTITLNAVEPDFDNAFGPLENPAVWKLQTLFQMEISTGLATICTVGP